MSYPFIQHDATNISLPVWIIDSTAFTPEEGVTSATAGLNIWYQRPGAAVANLTLSDLSALTDAHSDGGMLHKDDGIYRVDIPDAAFASGVNHVTIGGTATGMILMGGVCPLVAYSDSDIDTKLGFITSTNSINTNQLARPGQTITIFQGESLNNAEENAIEFSIATPDLTGYTAKCVFTKVTNNSGDATLTLTGTVVNAGTSTQLLRFEDTAADTATLALSDVDDQTASEKPRYLNAYRYTMSVDDGSVNDAVVSQGYVIVKTKDTT